MKTQNNYINYIEFKCKDIEQTKVFYNKALGWKFTDYGENYIAFENSGVAGGFELTDAEISNGVLVILYHSDLEVIKKKVIDCGGRISVDIFSFPGGKRFQFLDPSGNELAVWSE